MSHELPSAWVCDNEEKIGKDIYGVTMENYSIIEQLMSPQIIVAVAAPKAQLEIKNVLSRFNLHPGKNYWFFS